MATKYLHSLGDENPDLRKQIGCMTGVFHLFNRNQIVSRTHVSGHGPKRLPHGGLLFNNGTPERESSVISQRNPNLEKHSKKHFMEKHRVSTESYQESLSPFSYVNRRPNPEQDKSSASRHQNLDLRDIVKDSIYREARGLSHNVLVELQEPDWYYCNELSRSKSHGFSKIYPRFSYDAHTTTPKQLQELPRLSLDSKERSIRTLNSVSLVPFKPYDSRPNLNSRNPNEKPLIQTKPPNVVAKLMGLETFPNSASTSNKDLDLFSKSFIKTEIKMPNSTREPTSECSEMKPISRVPVEAAPWKNPQKPCPRVTKSSSVYSEVDKRLKHLEFLESGKDLRALKQILESMQAVEARKGKRDNTVDHQKPPSENVSRGQESHIVIMKPGKIIEKGFISNNNYKKVKDPNTRKDYAETLAKDEKREKLQNVEALVKKLKRLNSSHNEAHTDYIASLCENTTNPNDRYISEILLASGLLLRDLESFEFHSSGHPVNPELFLVLERTKFGNLQKEKFHRKLIFDVVNEILVEKLNSVSLIVRNPRELLREVCLEIEQMQVEKKGDVGEEEEDDELERILREDVMRWPENWRGVYGGSPVVAMEVEWLIFGDLVNELVVMESERYKNSY